MTEQNTATVASARADGNVVKMRGVDLFKTKRTNPDGRFYTSRPLGGEWVEFAVKTDAVVDSEGSDTEVDVVEMNDVDLLTRKRVLDNGHLHLGDRYREVEATVALRVVENPDEVAEQAEATENESATVHS